jgi:secreted trypsin-like serine protease
MKTTQTLCAAALILIATVFLADDSVSAEIKRRIKEERSFVVKGSVPYVATVRRALAGNDSQRVVGGEPAQPGSRPWQVALLVAGINDNAQAQFCGGTLISPQWVITAAHCVDGGMSPSQVAVLPGTHSLSDPKARRVAVTRLVVHPQWNKDTNDRDIALLQLTAPVLPGPAITPIRFATSAQEPKGGTPLTVSGWGATKQGGAGSILLMTVDVPVVPLDRCNQSTSYNGAITDRMVCAGRDEGGRDSCQGDSGGPAVIAGDEPTLVGVVSWGHGCAKPWKYGVYTRLGAFAEWIRKTSGVGAP